MQIIDTCHHHHCLSFSLSSFSIELFSPVEVGDEEEEEEETISRWCFSLSQSAFKGSVVVVEQAHLKVYTVAKWLSPPVPTTKLLIGKTGERCVNTQQPLKCHFAALHKKLFLSVLANSTFFLVTC